MPPDDPLGRNGPTLDQFLRKKVKPSSQLPQPCPYGKKCTYGNKCKYYHPDRVTNQKSITEKLKEQYAQGISEMRARVHSRDSSPGTYYVLQNCQLLWIGILVMLEKYLDLICLFFTDRSVLTQLLNLVGFKDYFV